MPNKPVRKPEIAESTLESEIFTAAVRFSDQTLADTNKLLSQWGMTALQHNALRVLYVHDTEGNGLPSSEIGKRLYTRVPDVTRLLDRLAERGWLIRERDEKNRRVVRSRLTEIGVELVESAHTSLRQLEKDQLAHMSETDQTTLQRLLNLAQQLE
ncbi:MAG: MarR family winged helix-turn-helix transcriptional regulator [Thiolinea sp.]